MKKIGVFAVSVFGALGAFFCANAAYPVYNAAYPANTYVYPTGSPNPASVIQLPSSNSRVVATSGGVRNVAAAQPTRVTGALPRVGSNATNAGRQYYQPSDFERLADSGIYVGLSVGYSASVIGSMTADYKNESGGFLAPGAFKDADFDTDTVIPLQISLGAAINNDLRADFSYTRYSGIGYPVTVETADGVGGYVPTQNDGGAITSNIAMVNLYYNVDSFTGYLAGGTLRPYVGVGAGLALNTTADYVVYDGSFYSEQDPGQAGQGELTGVSDIYGYHNGGTTEQLAFMFEGGITTDLGGGIKMDFFVRYMNMGKVKTSGSVVVSQTNWYGDGYQGEYPDDYDTISHYTDWTESGRLSTIDIGARLRLQF